MRKTTAQFIEDAIRIHGNFYDYSKSYYTDSFNKVTIICPNHGEFEQLPANHTRGQGCPKCKVDINKNAQKFIDKSSRLHNNFYDYSKVDYISANTKVIIICPDHGEFEQLPSNHNRGQGCPKCKVLRQYKSTITLSNFIEQANIIHNNFYNYSDVEINSNKDEINIICPEHGKFSQKMEYHLKGRGCPQCAIKTRQLKTTKTTEQFINESILIHGNLYDYSKLNYIHSEKNVTIICSKHGEFELQANQHLQGKGCQKCAIEKRYDFDFIGESNKIHNNFYNYSKVDLIDSKTKVIIICPKHGEFLQRPNNHMSGQGCPQCANGKSTSKAELEIVEFLKSLNISNIIQSSRNIIPNRQELDIYLPDFNLAIEFNGLYWHNEDFQKDNYHLQKLNVCLENNINLIQIFEDEWVKNQEIVKSRLTNILHKIKNEHKIFGRDCYVREITIEQAKNFCNNNHLQGFVGAKIHLGLFFKQNNQEYLVSYMSFGALRKNISGENKNEYEFELLRFCNVKNYSIIGGANKLLKYFEKNYNPKYIISYADRRWSNGNLYKKMGFLLTRISPPNYFYIQGLKRLNRINFTKDKLIKNYWCKPEDTERNFCYNELDLRRIYDCGNLVFEKYYN